MQLYNQMQAESYTPRIWRTHSLHICPPDGCSLDDPLAECTLNWIFLVSSLNFSFWSEKAAADRFAVEWRAGWEDDNPTVWTGYWSLLACLNRAIDEGIPITDPHYYSNEDRCSNQMLEHIFRPADGCNEKIPLLAERIAIMRENGAILCNVRRSSNIRDYFV